ncbi:MAG: ribosomal protein S18-alanine N-acetyltransferase [Leptolyngbyaceae bacterium]|nr:ribosomal protein S18-alanine N-acetyltransferase [Leptolyngbyaceae bacterium]
MTVDLLPAVLDLDQLCLGGLWTLEGYQRELASPNSDLLVLSSPEALIGLGCLWAILEEAHITILGIRPDYQGQGLGQALFLALLVSAQKRGLERATLEVRASNQAALALYQKFGLREAGRRRHYYPDTGEDALILWRSGLQAPQFEQALETWHQQIYGRLQAAGWCLFNESV